MASHSSRQGAAATKLQVACLVVSLVCLEACAASSGARAGASPAPDRETKDARYGTPEDAQRALSAAERDLLAVTMPPAAYPTAANAQGNYAQPAGVSPPPPPPAASPPPAPAATQAAPPTGDAKGYGGVDKPGDAKPAPKEAKEEAAPPAASPCQTACHALDSMKRAADAICRMTSESDPRCTDAHRRVNDSTSRVSSCACGAP